ncbi:MAG: long-chain fatty acid--CoA ligase [Oceanospirillaceae bacterium]|nr:long-chain fatty acid--CoA ligase [Oceanospirillaceae bacterium]
MYGVFKRIVLSMFLGEEIVLLDPDFSESELEKILGVENFSGIHSSQKIENSLSGLSIEKLIEKSKDLKSWRITLYTSGTTGLPKPVTHTFENITRHVKKDDSRSSNIWGLAYNPTHMAGLQVFFQALLNQNTIVRLFQLDKDVVSGQIEKHKVTHLSGTPTFYRLNTPRGVEFSNVVSVTSGGEKLDTRTMELLKSAFPNASIKNIYASTEAGSLFLSEDDVFKVRNSYTDLVRIDENELLLHRELMGQSKMFTGDWYRTGDLVEVVGNDPLRFKFISREGDVINVGGYQVNLIEVEDVISQHPDVMIASVYAKNNALLGNVVIAEVVSLSTDLTEKLLLDYLRSELQEFKIPRMIKFTDEIKRTRTGKKKRN